MFSEVLPNCAAPLIVQASLGVSTAILDAAALGFLGLGAQPPAPEWGTMLADAREFVLRAWWVVTFPGLMILITVLAFNLLGDGLRDALDPKLKRLMAAWRCSRSKPLTSNFPTHGGVLHAVDGVEPHARGGRGAGHRRRIGLGQERHHAGADGAHRLSRPRARRARCASPATICSSSPTRERRRLIGKDMAMIFQEPTTSLNPCFTIGFQIMETLRAALSAGPRRGAPPRRSSCSSRSASRRPSSAARRLSRTSSPAA